MMIKDPSTGIIYEKKESPSPSANVVLLLVHGLGGHSGRWDALSAFFAGRACHSYAIDLRGFGRSEELPGDIDSFRTYYRDLLRLKQIIDQEHPGAKCFLVGESMGGLLSFLLVCGHPQICDGLICISPAFKSNLSLPLSLYARVFSALVFNPRKQFRIPFAPGMFTRDKQRLEGMQSDPREHGLVSARLLWQVLLGQLKAAHCLRQMTKPAVFLLPEEDCIVSTRFSERIFRGLPSADKTMIHYPGMSHALSIDLDKEKVFADVLQWIEKRRA